MKASKRRNPVAMATAIIACLTLITTFVTCGVLARYSSNNVSGDDARVAKFGALVMLETGPEEIILKPDGVDIVRTMSLSFPATEVATQVSVIVTAQGWTYKDGDFIISNGSKDLFKWTPGVDWSVTSSGDTHTFTKTLASNEGLEETQFLTGITNDMVISDQPPAGAEYSLQFTAEAVQID